MPARDVLTVLSEERAVVDAEGHAHRRFVNGNWFERLRVFRIADCVAYLKTVDTDHGAYVTVFHYIGFHMTHAGEGVQFFDLGFDHRAIFLCQRDHLSVFEFAAVNATDGDTAYVRIVIKRCNQHLRCTGVIFRRRDILDDGVHQVRQIGSRFAPVGTHPTLLG